MLKISNRNITDTQDAPAIIMNEAIHGDEFLNITARLPEKFLENNVFQSGFHSFLDKGGALYLTPVQNPDGYDRVQRENKNGLDLNRDYPLVRANKSGFTQPETTSLVQYISNDIKSTGRMGLSLLRWGADLPVGSFDAPTDGIS
jgi:predicted deacylase